MATKYPAQIDDNTTLPEVVDKVTVISGVVINRLKDAIIAIENELGEVPSGLHTTVKNRLDTIEAITLSGAPSGIPSGPATGDLAGTYPDPRVTSMTNSNGTITSISGNKFINNRGLRRNVLAKAINYTILDSDDIILANSSSGIITVNLPASPVNGDQYEIKDKGGAAATYIITVSGNGNNIDGAANFYIYTNYSSYRFIFSGSEWSVI